jgi:hypothetical protein
MSTPLLTASQVARQLNLSAERVRQLARQGKLPPAERTPLGQLWDPAEVGHFAEQRQPGCRSFTPGEDDDATT